MNTKPNFKIDYNTKMLINMTVKSGKVCRLFAIYGVVKQLLLTAQAQNKDTVYIPVLMDAGISQTVELKREMVEMLVEETEKQQLLKEQNRDIIPKTLKEYLVDVTLIHKMHEFKNIVGREHEIDKCWFFLSQYLQNNVFLIGPHDVGKTTIANALAKRIRQGNCPKSLEGKRVIMLDPEALYNLLLRTRREEKVITTTVNGEIVKNVNKAELIFNEIRNFIDINKDNIILFVDEAIYMLYEYNLIMLLYYIIKERNIPFIATALPNEFERFFLNNPRISKFLNYIQVREIPEYKMKPVIEGIKDDLQQFYSGITISDKMIDFAIYTSRLDSHNSVNPGRTINIVRKAFNEADRQEKTEVDQSCILKNYDTYYEAYESIDRRTIRETAYHEAGHYLAIKLLNHVNEIEANCVSILPMMGWAGVNITARDIRKYTVHSADYFKDNIAISLAGRVAESLVNNYKYTSGASSDLQHAAYYAEIIVTRCALVENTEFENRVYNYNHYFRMPEETKKRIEDEIQKVIDEGAERAKKIIYDNLELLRIIAERLIVDEILTMKELDEICQDYFNSKEQKNN